MLVRGAPEFVGGDPGNWGGQMGRDFECEEVNVNILTFLKGFTDSMYLLRSPGISDKTNHGDVVEDIISHVVQRFLRWWLLKYFWNFHPPIPVEMIQFDEHIFQMGWFNHQLAYMPP